MVTTKEMRLCERMLFSIVVVFFLPKMLLNWKKFHLKVLTMHNFSWYIVQTATWFLLALAPVLVCWRAEKSVKLLPLSIWRQMVSYYHEKIFDNDLVGWRLKISDFSAQKWIQFAKKVIGRDKLSSRSLLYLSATIRQLYDNCLYQTHWPE